MTQQQPDPNAGFVDAHGAFRSSNEEEEEDEMSHSDSSIDYTTGLGTDEEVASVERINMLERQNMSTFKRDTRKRNSSFYTAVQQQQRQHPATEVKSLFSGEVVEGSDDSDTNSEDNEIDEIGISMMTPRASNRHQDRGSVKGAASPNTATVDFFSDNSSTGSVPEDWDLRHLQNVLGLNYSSRRRMRSEGIESVTDLYDVEDLLRRNEVQGLKSVETAKLLQFLDWVKVYQRRANGCLPDIERHFTRHEYEVYIGRKRSKSYTHVWPFMAVEESNPAIKILEFPILYALTKADVATPSSPASIRSTSPPATPLRDEIQANSTFGATGLEEGNTETNPDETLLGQINNVQIFDNFLVAEETHSRFQFGSRSKRKLKKCIDKYRLVVDGTAVTVEDCMIQAFSCIKLAILLQRVEYKNDYESLNLLKRAAEHYKVPTALFFYGYALVTGKGCIVKNVTQGISMLNEAAAAGVGEAYFVLGNIHEGHIDGIERDLASAKQFYDATANMFDASSRRAWLGMFLGTTNNAALPELEMDSNWDAELSACKSLVVAQGWFNILGIIYKPLSTVLISAMVAQILLIVAAAYLTQLSQTEHYSALLPAVPMLGVLFSTLFFMQALAFILNNSKIRFLAYELQRAKLDAMRKMLNVPIWNKVFVPPVHYLLLFHYNMSRWFVRFSSRYCRKQLEALDARILWLEAYGLSAVTHICTYIVDMMLLVIGIAFFVVWVMLLVQESQSYLDECSNWAENTCQGSLTRCNEEEQKLSTCFFLGPRSGEVTFDATTSVESDNLSIFDGRQYPGFS